MAALIGAIIYSLFLAGLYLFAQFAHSKAVGVLNKHITELGLKLQGTRLAKDDTIQTLQEQADIRNEYLDYLFQTFRLSASDPYVIRPTFEEKRCYHCHYPEYAGHDASCPWLHCRALTSALYVTPPVTTAATAASDGDLVIAIPDDAPESNTAVQTVS